MKLPTETENEVIGTTGRQGMLSGALHGRALLFARAAWLVAALLAVGLFVAGVPAYFAELQQVCTRSALACSNESLLTPDNARELGALGLSVRFYAAYSMALYAVSAAVWCAVGAAVFWRRSDDRMALLVSLFLVVFGTATFSDVPDALVVVHPGLWLPVKSVAFLGDACLALFFCAFPDGRFVPRWTRWLALVYVVKQAPGYFFPESPLNPDNLLGPASFVVFIALILGFVVAQVYRYRIASTPEQRRQTRWVVFGMAAAFAGFATAVVSFFITEPDGIMHVSYTTLLQFTLIYVSMLFIPISIGIAMLRSRLFDVDIVINRALVYGALTVTLVLAYVCSVVVLQYVFRALIGETSQIAVVASTLAIAALFNPLRGRIQDFIDRRFYRKKYDAAKTLEAFSARLRDETDLEQLNVELLSVVRETMQPAYAALWLRSPGRGKEV